jgi:hypothetical protein
MTPEERESLLRLARRLEDGDYEAMGRTAIGDAALLRRLCFDEWREKLQDVLERIGEMDPATDSIEGDNESGAADCFRQAQSAALMALSLPNPLPVALQDR